MKQRKRERTGSTNNTIIASLVGIKKKAKILFLFWYLIQRENASNLLLFDVSKLIICIIITILLFEPEKKIFCSIKKKRSKQEDKQKHHLETLNLPIGVSHFFYTYKNIYAYFERKPNLNTCIAKNICHDRMQQKLSSCWNSTINKE